MAISKKEIKNLSKLARIGVSDKEIESLQNDLEKILDFVSRLEDVSISEEFEKKEVLNEVREDEASHTIAEYSEELLKQAPEIKDGFVKVKKVL